MRIAIFLLCTGLLLPLASWAKIQCWTDEQGNRACGDQVPPQYAKVQRDVVNSQGIVVDTEARQKTPEEIAQDEKRAAEQKAAQQAAEQQAAYDRFLIGTYNSVDDIKAARDLRIQAIEGRLNLVRKSVSDSRDTLKGLLQQRDSITSAGKQPNPGLLKQIAKFQKSEIDGQNAEDQLNAEREQTAAKFAADIVRYQQLKQGAADSAR
ncbi:MAG TPA: hypothetical protein VN046_05035 [Stenotrophobium sp.]|jgi:hypothetical protein|nr:hypothetical protein [Stenotrophobium sp.]